MNKKETQLQQMLTQLRTRLLVMAAAVGIAMDEACEALMTGNLGRAGAVQEGDAAIDQMENEMDDLALSLLVRNQPVAQDLRFVIGALRMVVDLERIGDEAADIAERAIILNSPPPPPVAEALAPFMAEARRLYKGAVEAFRDKDIEKALMICRNEDEVNQMEVVALHKIMDAPRSHGQDGSPDGYADMHGILICRALNRICRRAANIAEHTYFITRGLNIKHKKDGLEC